MVYVSGLQVLVCIFLWLGGDVIKTMMAKLMANHFHQETYFQRMQEALRKVSACCLSVNFDVMFQSIRPAKQLLFAAASQMQQM